MHLLTVVLPLVFIEAGLRTVIINRLQQTPVLRFSIQTDAGAEEIHKEVGHFAAHTPPQEGQIAGGFRIGFPFRQIDACDDISMIDIKIMGAADIQRFIDAHTVLAVQYGDQQILYRQVAIMAEQHDAAFSERVFGQLITQATGGSPAESQKIVLAFAAVTQRISQFALFIKQAISLALGAVNAVQLFHHFGDGRIGRQQRFAQHQLKRLFITLDQLVEGNLLDIQTHGRLSF